MTGIRRHSLRLALVMGVVAALTMLGGNPQRAAGPYSSVLDAIGPSQAEATFTCNGYCVNQSSTGCAYAPELEYGCKDGVGACISILCEP